ncbi:hypothetical protein MC885_000442 [Smutsia gigantea]|nr:hypothetical protein MC885_000442 [Smutsia gigantea]
MDPLRRCTKPVVSVSYDTKSVMQGSGEVGKGEVQSLFVGYVCAREEESLSRFLLLLQARGGSLAVFDGIYFAESLGRNTLDTVATILAFGIAWTETCSLDGEFRAPWNIVRCCPDKGKTVAVLADSTWYCPGLQEIVLSMIINAAYKPGRVLRELQLVEDPHWNFQEETLKAKYRGKTYRAVAKIVRTSDQVADFCRRVCAKLECCPNLFSPVLVSENCPENCSVHTKTKYISDLVHHVEPHLILHAFTRGGIITYYYGKRKKIIKPPIGESNIESTHPKPARRRKRRKSMFVQKKRRSSAVDFPAGSGEESEEEDADAVEDDSGSEETGSELRDDQTDTSSAEVPSVRPWRAVTLRSSVELERRPPAERVRRGRRAQAAPGAEAGGKGPVAGRDAAEEAKQEEEERLVLESNPLEWTVTDVDIDGQALLLLTLPTVQECMELKLGPAIKLCHQIERVKVAFYAQYAN